MQSCIAWEEVGKGEKFGASSQDTALTEVKLDVQGIRDVIRASMLSLS